MRPQPLLVFVVPQDATPLTRQRMQRRAARLASLGFRVQTCGDVAGAHVRVSRARGLGVPSVAVLAGQLNQSIDAARFLRAVCPGTAIVALMHVRNDTACIQALDSGADAYCPARVSLPLLAALVFSLLRRFAPAPDFGPGAAAAADGRWALHEGGSVLTGPAGARIPLTTGERAFMATLLSARDARAPHRQLIDAVNACYANGAPRTHQARLGVLISRLRRKFASHGYDMPLKSVHNWGYMFTGTVASDPAVQAQHARHVP